MTRQLPTSEPDPEPVTRLFKVARSPEGLDGSPPIEATNEAEAATKFVADHRMAAGTYCVQEIREPSMINVRVRRVIEAHEVDGDDDPAEDVAWTEERADG